MSVYIKGMEMPKNCGHCPLHHWYWPPTPLSSDEVTCVAVPVCMALKKELPELSEERYEDCPLVPVPEHGRLIDADVLMERFSYSPEDTAEDRIWIRAARRIIIEAPTIIPAEEGNDNGQTDS